MGGLRQLFRGLLSSEDAGEREYAHVHARPRLPSRQSAAQTAENRAGVLRPVRAERALARSVGGLRQLFRGWLSSEDAGDDEHAHVHARPRIFESGN